MARSRTPNAEPHTDGDIELRAALPVPADQRWFWAKRWQEQSRGGGPAGQVVSPRA